MSRRVCVRACVCVCVCVCVCDPSLAVQVIKEEKLRLIAEGYGQCTWPDGSHYEGELCTPCRMAQPSPFCKCVCACVRVCVGLILCHRPLAGEWHLGLPHGEGTQVFENGETYIGEWEKVRRERCRP